MHQDLEFKVLLALIGDLERRPERILGQSDAVHQSKLVRPGLPELLAQQGMRQAEIQLDGEVSLAGLGGGLAEELPGRVASESMLGKGCGGVVLRRGAEYL